MTAITPLNMRRTLGRFATGVTVVTAHTDRDFHAMTANSFTSVSLEPPLVLVSVDTKAKMKTCLDRSVRFAISILQAGQERIAWHFAGRPILEPGELVEANEDGFYFVRGAIAQIGCEPYGNHEAGDHTLYLGRVVHLSNRAGDPLLFHGGEFELVERKMPNEVWW